MNTQTIRLVSPDEQPKKEHFRFDIFKGKETKEGKVLKLRSVGSATVAEGSATYHVHLKTLIGATFYLLPETKEKDAPSYSILTREPSILPGRKYFWHKVGDAKLLTGENQGLLGLEWDLFPGASFYMNLFPKEPASLPGKNDLNFKEPLRCET